MWPWEHLALSYIAVSILWRLAGRRVDDWVALSVLVASQLPDIVDKTMAWHFGVFPSGRGPFHSVFVALAVSVVVIAVARYRQRLELGLAFAVAYLFHLFGDALPKVLQGRYEDITFLLWPVLPFAEYEGMGSVVESLRELLASPMTYLTTGSYRTAILGAVLVVWAADGFPGVVGVGRYLTRRVRTSVAD
jgi:hypothetical protein